MAKGKKLFCKNCGFQGKPKIHTKGTFAVELILWCLLFVPGFCYTLWRKSNQYTGCPQCGEINMIPIDSPVAQSMMRQSAPASDPVPQPTPEPDTKKPKKDSTLQSRDEHGRYVIPES